MVVSGGLWGIVTSGGGSHWKVTGNEVSGTAASGIQLNDGDYIDVENNIVHGCAGTWSGSGSGISIYEPVAFDSEPGYHITVANNYSYANQNPVGGTDGEGITIDSENDSGYTQATLVENNVGYSNTGSCIKVNSSDGVTVLNNTCWDDNAVVINSYSWQGEVSLEYSSNNIVANNILVTNPSLNEYDTAILDGGGSDNTFANNLTYDGTAGQSSESVQSTGDTLSANLAGENPELVNPVISFMLQSGSPAIGSGTTAYGVPATDIDGTPRPASPVDLGAFQH